MLCTAIVITRNLFLPPQVPEAPQLFQRLPVDCSFGAPTEKASDLVLRRNPPSDLGHHAIDLLWMLRRQVLRVPAVSATVVQLDSPHPNSLSLLAVYGL